MGVLVGVVMVAAPRGIWWATESWKFRNPEANEPSDTSYALSRVGGVVVIIVALALGTSIIAQDHTKTQADKREQEAQAQREAEEAAFVVPPPESRGALPVIASTSRSTCRGRRRTSGT